jgi:hypothetical protein
LHGVRSVELLVYLPPGVRRDGLHEVSWGTIDQAPLGAHARLL